MKNVKVSTSSITASGLTTTEPLNHEHTAVAGLPWSPANPVPVNGAGFVLFWWVVTSGADDEFTAAPQRREELAHRMFCDSDAAFGRRKVLPREVEKDGAATIAHPRAAIVIKYDNDVIEMIVAIQTFMMSRIGEAHRAVVISVCGVVTPTIGGFNVVEG